MGNYGRLVLPPIELQRQNFKECCKLLGVKTQYQYPLENKQYNTQTELESSYSLPQEVFCIFNEKMDQKTAKRLGWNAEADTKASIISVPYDLENLQLGCLFEIPSTFDNTPGRKFRVIEMSAIMIYPASITCKLALEYETEMEKSDTEFFVNSNFNLLYEG